MKYGINSLAWISPFTTEHIGLLKKVKDMGFDVFEMSAEDPYNLDAKTIKRAAREVGIDVPIGGAFGPKRDMSSEDADIRQAGINHAKRVIDMAHELESGYVMGPMYSAVGKARQTAPQEKAEQVSGPRKTSGYALNMPRAGAYG
ncbi:MAG: sugar phosphate isomerase/epimerase family protein [Bacillota bacterium]|jgi:D-psicose/D-tagatose/L-ribulose 3-epimerase